VESPFKWAECASGGLKKTQGIVFEVKSIYMPANGFKIVKFLIVTLLL
jgi:hypothetical protein